MYFAINKIHKCFFALGRTRHNGGIKKIGILPSKKEDSGLSARYKESVESIIEAAESTKKKKAWDLKTHEEIKFVRERTSHLF